MVSQDAHRATQSYAIDALRQYFRRCDTSAYISGAIPLAVEADNPRTVVVPDVFVLKGQRGEPGLPNLAVVVVPDFVLEVTAPDTRARDLGAKRGAYGYLGVKEYWLFDPSGELLDPPLRGYSLDEAGDYQRLSVATPPGGAMSVSSQVLGLDLQVVGGELRFFEPGADRGLSSYAELSEALAEAERQVASLRTALAEAERRVASPGTEPAEAVAPAAAPPPAPAAPPGPEPAFDADIDPFPAPEPPSAGANSPEPEAPAASDDPRPAPPEAGRDTSPTTDAGNSDARAPDDPLAVGPSNP